MNKNTSKDDIQFLIDLQKELKHQSEHETDCQAVPRFWTVGDYQMSPVPSGFEEDITFNCPQQDVYGKTLEDLIDDIKEDMESDESSYTDEAAEEFWDIYKHFRNDANSVLGWIKEYYDSDAYIVPVCKHHIVRENTMFLTKKEAKRHIEGNRHHYTSEVHTYAMTAWRAPQVERLWKILEYFDWSKIEIEDEV